MLDDDQYQDFMNDVRSPFHKGFFMKATHRRAFRNPSCGDEITIQLKISFPLIEDAWFEGRGCIVSQAAASILCRFLCGKPLAEVALITVEQYMQLLSIRLSLRRQGCGLLPLVALRAIIADVDFRSGSE